MRVGIILCWKFGDEPPKSSLLFSRTHRPLNGHTTIGIRGGMEFSNSSKLSEIITFIHNTCGFSEEQKQIKLVLKQVLSHDDEILDQSKTFSDYCIGDHEQIYAIITP